MRKVINHIARSMRAMKGAFHRSLTVLVCYRFPLHVVIKHHYLAFDVSLPPPNDLSCSPKQLDSGINIHELLDYCTMMTYTFLSVCTK